MKITVIIPSFNAAQKVGACLNSLFAIDMEPSEYEVIFVDDCSSDETYQILTNACSTQNNWQAIRLEKNSGSPSRPRNLGTEMARGEYVFYLDCDDEILPDTLRLHCEVADRSGADMVRGYLYADDGVKRVSMNRLPEWNASLNRGQRIDLFLRKQSLTKTCLIRAELLRKHHIQFPEDLKMGEDTVFVAAALCAAENVVYIDHPTYVYNRAPSFVQSTTQSFGEKELCDQLLMWPRLQELFCAVDIDYYSARLHVNLGYVISLLIQKNRGDISELTFKRLSGFFRTAGASISRSSLSGRHLEIFKAIEEGNFDEFRRLARPRLLIAGPDLKFIASLFPALEEHFDIRVDEWSGHETHDEAHSLECLEWAECIWCEWMLGNAVWYSEKKKPSQRLMVRMHRFEVGLDYGAKLQIDNVDSIVTVNVLFFERLLERFKNIPRSKVRLIPVGYVHEEYDTHFSPERLFTIGMIGILPSGKGFDRCLQILSALRMKDSRFKLEVFGKRPEEVSWIASDAREMAFFERCAEFSKANDLDHAVSFNGHSDIRTALAARKVGFILSLSKQVRELPGFEAFHVAVGDGYAGGAVSLVLHYLGAEHVWDSRFIFSSLDSIAQRILDLSGDAEAFQRESLCGRELVRSRYGAAEFSKSVKVCFEQFW